MELLSEAAGRVEARSCVLRAEAFFVAWNGVVTLAYSGFPPGLARVKEDAQAAMGSAKENFGSKWPKTTLGALRDGQTLALEELEALHAVCERHSEAARASTWRARPAAASAVVFACRSIERVLSRKDHPFAPDTKGREAEEEVAGEAQRAIVRGVLAECRGDALGEYLPKVNRPGNREAHYRDAHAEATLVCFVGAAPFLDAFRAEVDRVLPGRYAWFDDSSLHATLRSLTTT